MKGYIVCEVGYQYDDENYSRTGGFEPIEVFTKKTNANNKCKELNNKAIAEDRYNSEYSDMKFAEYYVVKPVNIAKEEVDFSYRKALKAKDAAKKAALKAAQVAFSASAKELFDKNPELRSFGWKQYTDYFNDGSECTFSVHSDYPNVNGVCSDDIDTGIEYENVAGKWVERKLREPHPDLALVEPVRSFLRSFEDEDMLQMFGDHVEIVVDRPKKGEKVIPKVEEYTSHD